MKLQWIFRPDSGEPEEIGVVGIDDATGFEGECGYVRVFFKGAYGTEASNSSFSWFNLP